MIARDSFWAQVHAALDARRDPLEVTEVQRALAEEPELLDELAALRQGLELLGRSRRRRIRSFAAAAVLVACMGIAAWRATIAASSHAGSVDKLIVSGAVPAKAIASVRPPIFANVAGSRVIAFRAEVTLDGPHGRVMRTTTATGSVLASTSSPSERGAPFAVQTFVALMNPASQPR